MTHQEVKSVAMTHCLEKNKPRPLNGAFSSERQESQVR